jgi:predicted ATPase
MEDEQPLTHTNFHILTGAPGTGKSTVLNILSNNGVLTVPEPAREILREQRLLYGRGLPEEDPQLFVELILLKALQQLDSVHPEMAHFMIQPPGCDCLGRL